MYASAKGCGVTVELNADEAITHRFTVAILSADPCAIATHSDRSVRCIDHGVALAFLRDTFEPVLCQAMVVFSVRRY